MPRTPPPGTEPPFDDSADDVRPFGRRAQTSAIIETVLPEIDTGVHAMPLPPNATPGQLVADETRRRQRAVKGVWEEVRRARSEFAQFVAETDRRNIYLFGLADRGGGVISKLESAVERLGNHLTKLEAQHSTDQLETQKRLNQGEVSKAKLLAVAAAGGAAAATILQVILRAMAT